MNDLFFELIRVAIGNQVYLSHTPSVDEWRVLYAMAKKQSLLGICFAGVQKLRKQEQCPSETLYFQWLGMAAKIQQRNEAVNRQCIALQKFLADGEMRSSILKGQGVALCYGVSLRELRQSGDIDVYVDCGRVKAIEYAHGIQNIVDWDYKHLHLKLFQDTEVEMHYVPEVFLNLKKNKKLQKWFKEHQDLMFTKQGEIVTPSVEFNAFYILLHIYRHFMYEGVGMRQLMDLFYVLKTLSNSPLHSTNSGQVPKENLKIAQNAISELGMMRFANGVMWIMLEVFGLEKENLLCDPDDKEGRYILREVMEGGNFGHHDERLKSDASGKVGAIKSILKHNLHLLIHYPSDVIWAPIWMLYHWCWKKSQRI